MEVWITTIDEVGGESDLKVIENGPSSNCKDEELVEFLYVVYGDPLEDPDWKPVEVVRGTKLAAVEWRSSRGHLGVSTVIWP